MKPGWFDLRFEHDDNKIRTECRHCGRHLWFPPSKAGKYITCGGTCSAAFRASVEEARKTNCQTCGKVFLPRTTQLAVGHGRFCSQACNTAAQLAVNSAEAQERARETLRILRAAGKINYARGEKNKKWRGGRKEIIRRLIESGVLAQRNREYRAKNPDKLKEWAHKRKSRKLGKLPRGTVKKIGQLQRWLCACCRVAIKDKYHIDHIMPLAKGGTHEPKNIQLLCKACNLTKSAKHPIDFMQSRGYLL